MNRNKLKTYAPQARRDFIRAVTDRAAFYGLMKDKVEPVVEQGDVAIIAGKPFPQAVAAKRKRLEERIRRQGFEQVIEAMAYTWFNRLVAIRFMELHGYLGHGYRVLSHPEGNSTPEIVEHAEHVDLPGLNQEKVIELKLEGTKEAELYRMLLVAQCNALHKAMPFLFEWVDDETELLLPENLLHSDSVIRKLVKVIPEEDWQKVEIIGWLYQFYISEKKDQVIGKVVKSEDIPAATQLFTPNWIVRYMVQNTLGRQWMATYSHSSLKEKMEFYIEPAEQTPEVQEQLKAITPDSLNPEELTLLDPACGSGHILVEAYDLLKGIYQERGYRAKDIPRLILQKNLYGLEIDDRAAQLAAFALMMKARADDRRIFSNGVRPHVLAIQESKGLKAKDITEALNAPILKAKLPPREFLFEEMEDERAPLFSRKNLSVKGDIAQADVAQLIDLFEHGKTFGSLIRVPDEFAEKLPAIAERVKDVLAYGEMFGQAAARALETIVDQARMLAHRYDNVAMNPPYMGGKAMNPILKTFVKGVFPQGNADLFAAFIERGFELASNTGHNSMITMQSWMFLSSFQGLREELLSQKTFVSMAHLGARAFSTISGEVVQTSAFSAINRYIDKFGPVFFRLTEGDEEGKAQALLERVNCYHVTEQHRFEKIPGSPLAYWASPASIDAFTEHGSISDSCDVRQGLATAHDERFIRLWHEVAFDHMSLSSRNADEALQSGRKWFPFSKGGTSRKWYGNNDFVVNWENDGKELKDFKPRSVIRNESYYFRKGITWSLISGAAVSFRELPPGFIMGHKGPAVYPKEGCIQLMLGYLNSSAASHFLGMLSPNLGVEIGNVKRLPMPEMDGAVQNIVLECVRLSKEDWDGEEISWDFQVFPFFQGDSERATAATSHKICLDRRNRNINRLTELEQENNAKFIIAFGLDGDISPRVEDDEVSLYHPNDEEDIKRLISYAIGCMMGRYSLDKPGLIYARSGNQGFDSGQYTTFPADQDGIIPITDTDWFEDDAANRMVEFIGVTWPKEHLEENLEFVSESLAPKQGESPRETIRRYLFTGFYKHHLSKYKKRPIYWLFSSGKLRAFQCLVYLHRYNEGTLSRIRTEYVIPLQGKISARINQLSDDIASATSTSHRKKLEREQDKLVKQQAELQSFDEKLRQYADKRISLDLDDGVKVNYGKFGDLLAEVKAVTAKKGK